MHKNGLIVLAVTLGLAFVAYTYAMTAPGWRVEVFGCSWCGPGGR
jgi:hypothetical protein